MADPNLDQLSVNTIRFLAADAVELAQSGHAGTPMGAAPIAYVLWKDFLRHSPSDPKWANRDRFVLSSGHASMLLYSLLHLTGYAITLEDLKLFRQWESITPGHPEYGQTPGVEISTGPLGQGFANAVGMAIAEAHLAARYNRADVTVVDHYTYVLASDGDLMEGVAAEAASLAGHLGLDKLICLYDDNQVTIEGSTELAFTEDTLARFDAYGWHTQSVGDANDLAAVSAAIRTAQRTPDRPSIVAIRSVIGFGSPSKQGTAAAHSGALGAEDLRQAKELLGWEADEPFHVPTEVREHFGPAGEQGRAQVTEWKRRLQKYRELYPDSATELDRVLAGTLPQGWTDHLPDFAPNAVGFATRTANAPILAALAGPIPELIGGSADLAPSNITNIEGCTDFGLPSAGASYEGRILHFGVREHAMGSILNGMAVHGGTIPFGATFFTFSDYMRPAIRLAAMMQLRVIYAFTHDSIAVGEDGPTHQPIEHLASLRAIPNLTVIRPCDANEAVQAWRVAINNAHGPTALVLSRQDLPVLDRKAHAPAQELDRGAYIVSDAGNQAPRVILIATGSEVHLAMEAQARLAAMDVPARVVSMPSWELFDAQPDSYKSSVLPNTIVARVAIEAGSTLGWERWVGDNGRTIGIDRFGASAPADHLTEAYGFTVANVVGTTLALLKERP